MATKPGCALTAVTCDPAGVSHGAPRSHFIDRQARLDALAERGFDRFTQQVRSISSRPEPLEEKFRRLGRGYVDFAVDDAALMELMFASKMNDPPVALELAAARLFEAVDQLMDGGSASDGLAEDARFRFRLLFAAAMQGTATLVAARRITRDQGNAIADDAIEVLLKSEWGVQLLPPS